MATIGKLVVSLQADSAKLVKGLNSSQKSLKSWAGSAALMAAKVTGIFAGLATFIGGALIVAVNRNAAAIDDVTKSAGKLEFPIEDFQRFSFIADKSNIDIDVFGKSMQRMLKTVGDARAGLTTATDALDQLGLSADDLARMSPSDQFALIAERMKDIPLQADKVKIAMDIFGRGGADLLNVFQGDIKGIGDEFDSLGITITQQQADMVAAFQDSKTSLSTLLGGFGKQFTAEVAPAFTLVIEKITQSIKEMGGMKSAAQSFAKFIVGAMIATAKAIGGAVTAVQELILALKKAQLMYMLMDNLAGKLVPFGEDYSPTQLQKVADDILKMEQRIASGNGMQESVIDFMESLRNTVEQQQSLLPNDLKLPSGERDYSGIVAAVEGAKKAGQAQESLAASATEAAKVLEEVAKSTVWKDIFGKQEITARSNQFDTYAKLAKSNIDSGSSYSQSNINTLKSILDTAKNNGGVGFSNNDLFEKLDLTGMAEVVKGLEAMATIANKDGNGPAQSSNASTSIDKLIQAGSASQNVIDKLIQNQQNQQSIGTLTLNIVSDAGARKFDLKGDPEALKQVKEVVESVTKERTRQAAQ